MIWVLIGIIWIVAVGIVLYFAEKGRYCPECGRELKIWSYKKMICSNRSCNHTTT